MVDHINCPLIQTSQQILRLKYNTTSILMLLLNILVNFVIFSIDSL